MQAPRDESPSHHSRDRDFGFPLFCNFFRKIINRFALPIIRSDKESLSATLIGIGTIQF